MRTIHSDVAIIGGGLVGTWTAYFLRKRGHSVAVHRERRGRQPGERRQFRQCSPGRASSGRISARAARHRAMGTDRGADRRAMRVLAMRSLLYRARPEGTGAARTLPAGGDGGRAGDRADRRERSAPAISLCSGRMSAARRGRKRDGTANPRLATPAVARAARALGAEIFPDTRVVGLEPAGERFRVATDRDLVVRGAVRRQRGGRLGQRDRRAIRRDHADVSGGAAEFRHRAAAVFHHMRRCRRSTAR